MRPVIVIFGAAVLRTGAPSGAMRLRVESALATGAGLSNPLYMPTGGQGRYGRPEADIMAELLIEGGVDAGSIVRERTGRNTLGSALACAALIGRSGAPVYSATSGYHLLRCLLLLRLAGLPARPARLISRPASVRFRQRWFWRLREVPAVPVDVVLLLWRRLGQRRRKLRLKRDGSR